MLAQVAEEVGELSIHCYYGLKSMREGEYEIDPQGILLFYLI